MPKPAAGDIRNSPHPIDIHVGSRIRLKRIIEGLSQWDLAAEVGVTSQAIQKYERATCRASASMLWKLATALNTSVSAFYEGLADAVDEPRADPGSEAGEEYLTLFRAYRAIPTEGQRRALRNIARELSTAGATP